MKTFKILAAILVLLTVFTKSALPQTIHIEDACAPHSSLANWPVSTFCPTGVPYYATEYTNANGDITIAPFSGCNRSFTVQLNGATSVTSTGNIRYVTAPFVVDFKINGALVSTSSFFNFSNVNYINGSLTIPMVNMTTYSTGLQYRLTMSEAPAPSYTATTLIWNYGWSSIFPTELYNRLPAIPNNLTYIIKLEAKNSCGNIKTIIGGFKYNAAPPPACTPCVNNLILNSGFNTGAVTGNTGLVAGNMFPGAGGTGSVYKWSCLRSALARNTMGYCDNGYVSIYGSKSIQSFLIQNAVPFVGSTTYTVKFWARLSSSTTVAAKIKCFAYTTSPNPANYVGITPEITSANWNQYTMTFTAPPGATKLAFCPMNENNSSTNVSARSWVDIDNICLEAGSFVGNTCITDFAAGPSDYDNGFSFSFLPNDGYITREYRIARVPKGSYVPNGHGGWEIDPTYPYLDVTARRNAVFNNISSIIISGWAPCDDPNFPNSLVNGETGPIGPNGITYTNIYHPNWMNSTTHQNGVWRYDMDYWYILWVDCPTGTGFVGIGKTFLIHD